MSFNELSSFSREALCFRVPCTRGLLCVGDATFMFDASLLPCRDRDLELRFERRQTPSSEFPRFDFSAVSR